MLQIIRLHTYSIRTGWGFHTGNSYTLTCLQGSRTNGGATSPLALLTKMQRTLHFELNSLETNGKGYKHSRKSGTITVRVTIVEKVGIAIG